MRRSIYNDYRPLRIALLLLIVVLGLLIYMRCTAPCEHTGNAWEVTKEATCTENGLRHKVCTECETPFGHEEIPAFGHTPLASVDENKVGSTCTVGGSHDEVVYCKTCDAELQRDTVADELLAHKPGKVKAEDTVPSTHTVPGSYNDVIRCTECDFVISSVEKVIDPIGHNYTDWSCEYDETTGEFVFTGCCVGCQEADNTITVTQADANENLKVTITYDAKYAPCCKNQYLVELVYKYEYDGKNVTKTFTDTIELEKENHKLYAERVEDVDGNTVVGYIDVTQFARYDDLGAYYDVNDKSTEGYFRYAQDAEWNDDGFTYGYFVCVACQDAHCQECCDPQGRTWIVVRLYSAEHDKNLV